MSLPASHAAQVAALGSAANLDPNKYPRRAELAEARKKFAQEQWRAPGPDESRAPVMTEMRLEVTSRLSELRELAKTATLTEASTITGLNRETVRRVTKAYGITFKARYSDKRQQQLLREDWSELDATEC